MEYKVTMTPLKRNDHVKAVGILSMGDVRVRNFTLMENKEGGLFLVMPNRDTGKKGADGKHIYEEICHPITKEMREELNKAAIDSYKSGHPISLRDQEEGKMLVQAEVFDTPYFNRVGKAQLLINEKIVIKNIFINQKADGSLYVSMPNYKTNQKNKDGKELYSEIISMSKDFRKEVCAAVLKEYQLEKAYKEQNRLSIKSRLLAAQGKAEKQEPASGKSKQKEETL